MHLKFRLKSFIFITAIALSDICFGQSPSPSLPSQSIHLTDLDSFQKFKKGKWKIAGAVSSNRKVPGELESESGEDILIFDSVKKGDQALTTKQEFGDFDLEFDFLLTRGSSFTTVLHDHYPIKTTDLWMVPGNEALKAPGLWQHLHIKFKAPVFDVNGKKLRNGQFEEILLNGQPTKISSASVIPERIQRNDEKPLAPFSFVGNDVPFAIRNIQYKTYDTEQILLSYITFKVYQGLHKNIDTLQTLKPKRTGVTDTISHLVGDRKSQLVLDGMIDIPRDGEYLFKLTAGGGAWFFIDQKLVIENRGTRDFERAFYEKIPLKKGKYPFKVVYSNSDECLVLDYEGPTIPWRSLTTPASVRLSERFEPLEYEVKNRPVLQRGFMMNHQKVNPYTASVGIPAGNNYAYDMKTYNLLAVWHGHFIDVSNMWRERGEKQMEIPLGAKLEFSGKPVIAKLVNAQSAWPDSAQALEGVFSSRGYKINGSGFPHYFYKLNDTAVDDLLYATLTNDGLTRELKVTASKPDRTFILIAEGKVIEKMTEDRYAIDDKSYYIENLQIEKGSAIIRQDRDVQQLLVPAPSSNDALTIKYNIIW